MYESGKSVRYSKDLGSEHLFLAVPLKKDGKVVGVLRNSVLVEETKAALIELIGKVLIWSLLLVLLLSWLIYSKTKQVSAPLEMMRKHVAEFTGSRSFKKIAIPKSATEEIHFLARTINFMCNELQRQLEIIRKHKNEQEAVFSSMEEGVITVDATCRIIHANKAVYKLLGAKKAKQLTDYNLCEVVTSKKLWN